MQLKLNLNSLADYRLFLKIKELPKFRFIGRIAEFPDEYAERLGQTINSKSDLPEYVPLASQYDYQAAVSKIAIAKRKFAAFIECGRGKTLNLLEHARYASGVVSKEKAYLIVSPLMVIAQTVREAKRFYGDSLPIEIIKAKNLHSWLEHPTTKIGITNYEAITEGLSNSHLGGLGLDESSLLKSHYGKWGQRLIELGRGLEWKFCATGTPAPNDRIEYANHAVFLDQYPTVNSFLARFFVNRGQTNERWELKRHALRPFYRALSHWCIFLNDPTIYGWKDGCEAIPPIKVHIEPLRMSDAQNDAAAKESKSLFAVAGGITSRAKLSQIAKGRHNGEKIESAKPSHIRRMVESWPDESIIIWCKYNAEQDEMAELLPDAANISGATPDDERQRLIEEFQSGRKRVLISKPKILGFGLNLQICSRMIFSTLQDSYEEYWQAVKRANRIGSTRPLNVHLPIMEIERPMVENVLRKARMIERDTEEQERLFKEFNYAF